MDASKGGTSASFLNEESACYMNTKPFIVCLRFQGNVLNHLLLNHYMTEGMGAVVFLTVPDSFSCRSVVPFVVCYESGCCHMLYGEFNECLFAYFRLFRKCQKNTSVEI